MLEQSEAVPCIVLPWRDTVAWRRGCVDRESSERDKESWGVTCGGLLLLGLPQQPGSLLLGFLLSFPALRRFRCCPRLLQSPMRPREGCILPSMSCISAASYQPAVQKSSLIRRSSTALHISRHDNCVADSRAIRDAAWYMKARLMLCGHTSLGCRIFQLGRCKDLTSCSFLRSSPILSAA